MVQIAAKAIAEVEYVVQHLHLIKVQGPLRLKQSSNRLTNSFISLDLFFFLGFSLRFFFLVFFDFLDVFLFLAGHDSSPMNAH